jgi:hypothetical protein
MTPSSSALALRSIFFRSLRVAVFLEFGFNTSLICLFPDNEIKFRREFRCGGLTQRKLTTPGSPKRLQRQHTHKRHATPAPAHTTPAHYDLLRTACAPTSTHSNGFCVIWVCISSIRVRVRGLIWKGLYSNVHPRHWLLFHTSLYSLELKFELWSTQFATNTLPNCPHCECSQIITTITITTLPSP